jgi:hypothetical protein
MGNVYAANQVVDTTKSPTTFIDTTANGVDLINIGAISSAYFIQDNISVLVKIRIAIYRTTKL